MMRPIAKLAMWVFLFNISLSQKNCKYANLIKFLPESTPSYPSNWVLIFEDEFDTFDKSNWYISNVNKCDFQSARIQENVQTQNGILKLIARRDTLTTQSNPYLPDSIIICDTLLNLHKYFFSSACIRSKWQFPYGKFVARIKLPKEQGLFHAFWLVNGDKEPGYPKYSEIDIFEIWTELKVRKQEAIVDFNKMNRVIHSNLWYDYEDAGGNADGYYRCAKRHTRKGNNIGAPLLPDMSLHYYDYAVEWTPFEIRWYFDGALIRRQKYIRNIPVFVFGMPLFFLIKKAKHFPREVPMEIVFSIDVDKEAGIKNLFNKYTYTFTPANLPLNYYHELLVDYVKFYVPINCSDIKDVVIKNASQLLLYPKLFNCQIGKTIIFNCPKNSGYVVPSNYRLDVLARNSITIKGYFEVKEGAFFNAKIRSLTCSNNSKMTNAKNTLLIQENKRAQKERNDMSKEIIIYPNPVSKDINIKYKGKGNVYMEIYDIYGRKIMSRTLKKQNTKIEVCKLSQGIYIIKFNREGNLYIQKFVKL